MKWQVVNSIKKLPPSLWNEKVSLGYALTSEQFLAAVEAGNSHGEFLYFVAYKEEKIVACALLNICRVDLTLELPKQFTPMAAFFRKLWPNFLTIKVAMTGSLETYGSHFWYDESLLDLSTFIQEFKKEVSNLKQDYSALIMRDYVSDDRQKTDIDAVSKIYKMESFVPLDFLPAAELDISQFSTPQDYLLAMKSRDRYTLNKEIANAQSNGIVFEFVDDFIDLLDECYPLYFAVNQGAQELKSAPLSKRFFSDIKREFGNDAYLLTVKNSLNKLLAFTLITDTNKSMNIYIVGMDYEKLKKEFSMYNILWECIKKAIGDNRQTVELGLTNYFLKQRLGARVMPLTMFVQAKHPLVQRAIKMLVKNNRKDMALTT